MVYDLWNATFDSLLDFKPVSLYGLNIPIVVFGENQTKSSAKKSHLPPLKD